MIKKQDIVNAPKEIRDAAEAYVDRHDEGLRLFHKEVFSGLCEAFIAGALWRKGD